MNFLLNIMSLMLEQNDAERRLTTIGFVILAILFLVLLIDSAVKGRLVPKSGVVRAIILIIFILALGTLILIRIYYK